MKIVDVDTNDALNWNDGYEYGYADGAQGEYVDWMQAIEEEFDIAVESIDDAMKQLRALINEYAPGDIA